MGRKRCAACSTDNDAAAIYCRNCRSFLGAAPIPGAKKIRSVWETNALAAMVQSPAHAPGMGAERKDQWVAVCPDCGERTPVTSGRMPLFCVCGYSFQEQDKPVCVDIPATTQAPTQTPAASPGASPLRRRGPMKSAKEDRSQMILLSLWEMSPFSLHIREDATLLGTQSTDPALRSASIPGLKKQHLMVWHTPIGWYCRSLEGSTFYNGATMELGSERHLYDGDLISLGACPLRVQITAEQIPVVPKERLRLISLSKGNQLILVPEGKGGILGTEGNLSPQRFGKGSVRGLERQHLMVWWGVSGWQIRALHGETLYNGAALNLGLSQPISDGDLVNAGELILQAELSRVI